MIYSQGRDTRTVADQIVVCPSISSQVQMDIVRVIISNLELNQLMEGRSPETRAA